MGSLRKKGDWYYGIIKQGGRNIERALETKKEYEAKRRLKKLESQFDRSIYKRIEKIRFKKLSEEWLNDHKIDKKPNTIASYQYELAKHIDPFFGDYVVSTILPADVGRFKRELANKVSITTVNYNLRLLRAIFEMAVCNGYHTDNPAKLVPKLKQERQTRIVYSKQQAQELINAAESLETSVPKQAGLLIEMALKTGLREGELLGAKWDNLDWDKNQFNVEETYTIFGIGLPKTESSCRKVDLLPEIVRSLKKHKMRQNEYRLKQGGKFQDRGLIFPAENGNYLNPSNLRNRILARSIAKAKLPKIRFHDLRGMFATYLLEAGAQLKYVQEQLGHKTPDMTLGVYARLTQEAKKEGQEKFERFWSA